MDRGGCRLNGGGGGGDMITLEDLESVSEEQLSDSPEEVEEEEEQQGRLLQYWRDVARGHQVEVPTGNVRKTQQPRDASQFTPRKSFAAV